MLFVWYRILYWSTDEMWFNQNRCKPTKTVVHFCVLSCKDYIPVLSSSYLPVLGVQEMTLQNKYDGNGTVYKLQFICSLLRDSSVIEPVSSVGIDAVGITSIAVS